MFVKRVMFFICTLNSARYALNKNVALAHFYWEKVPDAYASIFTYNTHMTNAQAFDILQRWADKNMPKSGAINLGHILESAGAAPGEFAAFIPKKSRD